MRTRLLLLSCLALLSGSACTKEKDPVDTLPEATQTGVHTMGCLIDGKAFQPLNGRNLTRSPMGAYRFSNGETTLYFHRREFAFSDQHPVVDIQFVLLGVRGLGLYTLNQVSRPGFPQVPHATYRYDAPAVNDVPVREYRTSATATGQVLITRFDSVAKIISGTFEFTAQEVDRTGTVQVTQGRFDMLYR